MGAGRSKQWRWRRAARWATQLRSDADARRVPARMLAAATFFVAPQGDDKAAGTAEAPWKTLQHAADVVPAADTVLVRSGTYAGFDLRKSGTPEAPITFRAV